MRSRIINRTIYKLKLADLQGDVKWAICGNVYNGILRAGNFSYEVSNLPDYTGIVVVTFSNTGRGRGTPTVVRKCNGYTCELYKHRTLYTSLVSDKAIDIDTALIPVELLTCGAEMVYIDSNVIQMAESRFIGDKPAPILAEEVLKYISPSLRQLYAEDDITAALQIALEKLGASRGLIWDITD